MPGILYSAVVIFFRYYFSFSNVSQYPTATACPKTSDTPTAKGRGRCGPHFNNQVCSGSGYAIFCNEFNGWCGNTAAHRDAQPSTTYDASSIPAKCKRDIISLDHHKLTFASNSGTISDNTLILRNNQHADVSAKQLGDFGASDFTIELTYTGIGSDATPDGGYGTLFVRSSQHNQPYTGPSAFLYDNGKIIFRFVANIGSKYRITLEFHSICPSIPSIHQLGFLLNLNPAFTFSPLVRRIITLVSGMMTPWTVLEHFPVTPQPTRLVWHLRGKASNSLSQLVAVLCVRAP